MENLNELGAGDKHYKAYVGPPLKYDIVGAMQFNLLTAFGLRDYHKLLDIGCGSLRLGRLLIPYLNKNNYYGIEPNDWLFKAGIEKELGNDIIELKQPSFHSNKEFTLSVFDEQFDFMIAQSIFSHASMEQIRSCFTQAKKVLSKDGVFLATFVVGHEDYKGSEWVYPGCVNYKHSSILKLAKDAGLEAFGSDFFHPNEQSWYVIFHPEHRSVAKKLQRKSYSKQKYKWSLPYMLKRSDLLNNGLTRTVFRAYKKMVGK